MELSDVFINAATIIIGAFAITIRPCRRLWRRRTNGLQGTCWKSDKVITDFLNGSSTVPFICLVASPFYPSIVPIIMANKATMAIAGGIGLIAVMGEILVAGRDD